MYVFAFGSLLDPDSLRASVPDADLRWCFPATCAGYTRSLSVAFPNSGAQRDKAYYAEDGSRPPFVLMWDLVATHRARPVTGICIRLDDAGRAALEARELRYRLCDVTDRIQPRDPEHGWCGQRVSAFLGRPEFTGSGDVARGLVAQSYLDTTVRGARFWERRSPGFLGDFWNSTQAPDPRRIVALRRVDSVPARRT